MNGRAPIQRLEATFLCDAAGEQAIVGVAAVSPADSAEACSSPSRYLARLHTLALDHHHTPPGTAFLQMQIPRGLQCWQLTSFSWFQMQVCWSLGYKAGFLPCVHISWSCWRPSFLGCFGKDDDLVDGTTTNKRSWVNVRKEDIEGAGSLNFAW